MGRRTLAVARAVLPLARARARIAVEAGPWAGRSSLYERGPIRIGSAPGNDFTLPDPYLSGRHAELEVFEAGFLLRDLGSTNGTWLGDHRIREVLLAPGAVIGIGRSTIRLEAAGISEAPRPAPRAGEIVGESAAIRACLAQLDRYAQSDSAVLLLGETGVGKDLFARTLHRISGRRDGPFEVFDCGAATPSLIEAEIFGHVRGAYTDAKEARPGAFERANGGTLFIDEVGELPLHLQPRLLRILEEKVVRRIGDGRSIPIDVRVVCATHRDLAGMVARGSFRADLYYRLNVLRIEIPSLRQRKEDIPLLARALLAQQDSLTGPRAFDGEALSLLTSYDWPGNVRELRNVLQRAATLARGPIGPADLLLGERAAAPATHGGPLVDAGLPYHEAKDRCVDEFERSYVEELLGRHGDNVSRAAEAAGIPRQTLHRLITKHRIR